MMVQAPQAGTMDPERISTTSPWLNPPRPPGIKIPFGTGGESLFGQTRDEGPGTNVRAMERFVRYIRLAWSGNECVMR